ncbi:MAG: permease [Paenibacillaceae bacterium]
MPSTVTRWSLNIITLVCLIYVYLIVTNQNMPDLSLLVGTNIQSFKIMFISIILEAFPFILIGVLISALLQTFVPEHVIQRLVPRNPILGVLYACVIGIIFPICECGMIPVMRRLIHKGMPLYIAVVFIVAGPILNPIVFASTFMAFRSRPEITYSRMGLAFICALIIGLIVYRFVRSNPLRHSHHEHSHGPTHGHTHEHSQEEHHHHGGKWNTVLKHSSDEFFEMGKYLVFGAFLAALVQTMLSREWLVSVGTGDLSSHFFMMAFAYIISLCSTSDAFVASSFISTFSAGSLLSFLVFGPMLDFKGTLMLLAIFKTRFVLILSLLIFTTVLAASLILERILFL